MQRIHIIGRIIGRRVELFAGLCRKKAVMYCYYAVFAYPLTVRVLIHSYPAVQLIADSRQECDFFKM
jgi:hypothetical protein